MVENMTPDMYAMMRMLPSRRDVRVPEDAELSELQRTQETYLEEEREEDGTSDCEQ